MNYAKNVTELIGNTPLVKLNNCSDATGTTILGKCEFLNPSHSVKDRIGYNMIHEALERGDITKESKIIEPTSGNTGIGLAMVCASLGLNLTLTMPSSMSVERRKLLAALGAELVLTEPEKGMKGAVDKAFELQIRQKILLFYSSLPIRIIQQSIELLRLKRYCEILMAKLISL